MKLKLSLPSRPGVMYALPGFDFLLLLLGVLLLVAVAQREGVVRVSAPLSELSSDWNDPERYVQVAVARGRQGWDFFVEGEQVARSEVGAEITRVARERGSERVAVRGSRALSIAEEQRLIDLVVGAGLEYFRVVRRQSGNGREER